MVLFRIESKNGDDIIDVPKEQVPEKVNEQIQEGKWANIEKTDGTTETLTKEVPKENWQDVFGKDNEKVSSVTSTSKLKGG
jgi:hypothetical protein